ncbi:VOC family protein [Nonlabens xiamenensis]|uniref:VOC family protein n=1 Tax=Nonlabens xiamenensis TaxID=2341043 RepID=UPI000F606CCD|nr:VOC family protein [Nonlabens xiamenensis]
MNLNQITIPVTDVIVSISFYEQLGLNCIVHTHDDYARLELPQGEATLSLTRVDKVTQGNGIKVYFECADIDEKVAFLESKGIHFDSAPEDKTWLWREAHLRDPDGHHLILFRAGTHRKNPPWRKK